MKDIKNTALWFVVMLIIVALYSGDVIDLDNYCPPTYYVTSSFRDTATFTPTINVWHQVTDENFNLWPVTYTFGFTEENDTFISQITALCDIIYCVNAESKENKIWAYGILRKRGSVIDTLSYYELQGGGVMGYRPACATAQLEVGDKIWLAMTCKSPASAEGSYYGGGMRIMSVNTTGHSILSGFPERASFKTILSEYANITDSLKAAYMRIDSASIAHLDTIEGNVVINGLLEYELIHAVGSADSISYTPVVSRWKYKKLTPTLVWHEADGLTCSDSIKVLTPGDYRIDISVSLSGTNANDFWRIKVFKNNVSFPTSIGRFRFRTVSSGVSDTRSYFWYLEGLKVNDYISFRITNETASRNPTITDMKVYIEKKPEH
jgi:hypothetical protein